ncbi:hypothetical protein PHYBLDRAFT_168367 [Phycomyces blakesleeanus NRRL 1555(-)]|uniref:Uncharacterized protein n=1 Tax=Phycomyces blakesleeanus (strain ATCC 8743b / DSM 1359 / FGSC 10004 / NBRC 33097 / NRRL 1555) TaxID=763407 RepID=A0A162XCI8_PHYB8|nr:hypothetical protein PHYBLDRAFT_168367 [Phycomyces blakesleeanus NRRL 1555(-)]OAD73945.1 hypothetical protein PHYBLDRAFT_168367 [Phycomyces blakesleeanus NRRL 1555(-)]|eukprot:XP_018291985.1 hypothetical protein PHYBLDRAFT_168367 [Phycomyces blakesleeanus NRRL 1555(-)]
MFTITKLSHHECSICHKCYTNKKLVAKCKVQCLEKVYKEMNNTQSLQVASVSEQKSTNMSINKDNNPSIINEIDEPMYDIEHEYSMENDLAIIDVTENTIDDTSSQLVYDFSAPVPVSGYDDAKNLELMKIIKEFDISQKAHISLAKNFNEILSRSSEISYRACTLYLDTKLLSRFLGVDEETYHVCCNGCMLYNNDQQTECPYCDKACYKTGDRSQDAGEDPIPASTMIQLPLDRQLAVALANDRTRKEMFKDGCRICHVVGRSPGHGQYFRMPSAITMCTLESFKHFDEVASSSKKGLTGQSPFSLLDSFSGLFFFALDEMHDICHGIGKQVWGLKEIGTAMVSTRRSILTSFHGAWISIATRSGYFRAVDWADFILFVIPTLVAEHVRDQAARKALLDLVQTCNLLMSWELSAEEKTLIKTNLVAWNAYLEASLAKGEVQLKVFTINQHLLQHYSAMIEAYGPPRAYSARSVERAIGEYSRAIKTTVTATTVLQYDNPSAGWLIDQEGSNVGTDSDIEFWGPLRNRTIVDSFGGISCLPELLQKFYRSKGKECSMIEAAIKTSCKAFVNGCVIDSALDHNCVREAHNVRLQVQVNENCNIGQSYSPVYKDFFGKIVVFFEHKLNNKRWPLVLVNVYAVRLVNSIPAINNGQMKPMVVHLADVKELVGLVKSDATISTITTTATTYVVWPELNHSPKLSLGSLADL